VIGLVGGVSVLLADRYALSCAVFPDSKGSQVSILRPPTGTPDPEAADLIGWIRGFARQPAADNLNDRIQHARDLHHIYTEARAAFEVVLAIANTPGPGKASLRAIEAELGIHKDTVKYHVDKGKALLADEEDAA